ncbi:MAG: hypothetical protein R3282_04630, partial [Rhodothermales bacterium]|nr:hypothetical protein [Rhodothermales bacterium]
VMYSVFDSLADRMQHLFRGDTAHEGLPVDGHGERAKEVVGPSGTRRSPAGDGFGTEILAPEPSGG